MRKTIFVTFLAACPFAAIATGSAPFCVYSSGPSQCFYYSVDSCQNAAHALNGMCAPNNAQPPATGIQTTPSPRQQGIYDSLMDGIRLAGEGARAKQSQQPEQSPTMSWDEAAKAVEASVGKRQVIYSCTLNGQTTLSTVPKVGCIVAGFGDQIP